MHPKYIIAGNLLTGKIITLYGSSCDFGSADFRHLKLIDRELKNYTFIFTPILDLPGNVLDLSDVEWI